MSNFMQLCLAGKAQPTDIDSFVSQWHKSDSTLELDAYLGLTEEEYDLWLVEPDALADIVKSRNGLTKNKNPTTTQKATNTRYALAAHTASIAQADELFKGVKREGI
jgi:hypothetical protein